MRPKTFITATITLAPGKIADIIKRYEGHPHGGQQF
jgi:hypothetical protein